jgi:hypothetical protein
LLRFLTEDKANQDKLQMNHQVNSITFGDESHQEKIKQTFGGIDHGEHTIFNMFNLIGKTQEDYKQRQAFDKK